MASPINAAVCALAATVFWTLLGYAVGRRILPRALALGAAPVLGWAVHSAATLPILELIGFTPSAVIVIAIICTLVAAGSIAASHVKSGDAWQSAAMLWTCAATAAAAVLALAPAAAIVPKFSAGAVYLADPIFDHSKIAIIDAMARQGLPPVNPIFGAFGAKSSLAYYYLWHFSAAQLALPLGASGWEADIGLTWFTAFASLALMMGLAVWLARDVRAAFVVVILAVAGSLRATLGWISGAPDLAPFLAYPNGFAGWLFQSAWVPQHLMSASCVVTAMLLATGYALRPRIALLPVLALTVAAGFESSTYVGGVTFAIAALAATPVLSIAADRPRRLRFAAAMALAAFLVVCLVAPFILNQLAAVAARHDPTPIVISPFEVLGDTFSDRLGRLLDLPAYWLIELPLEFPATFLAGTIAFAVALRSRLPRRMKTAIGVLGCLAGAGLCTSWLLASTLGSNNDLALRAVLPAALILIAGTAAAMTASPRRALIAAVALVGFLPSLPDAVNVVRSDIEGHDVPDAKIFARTPELWNAVRRYAGPADRVANNPLFLQDPMPWPVNMSWALLANRSSCFAGSELALAFAPLPVSRRQAIDKQFVRVFDGEGTTEDVRDMASEYGCDVVVVTAQDQAWSRDLFAATPYYRLAASRPDRWKIYIRTAIAQK